MASLGNYDTTEGADEDGIVDPFGGPFLARDAVEDSAGAMVHRGSMADMANSSGRPALSRLHHDGSSFGYHHPLQQFTEFPQHVDATDSTPIDPSLSTSWLRPIRRLRPLKMPWGSPWPEPAPCTPRNPDTRTLRHSHQQHRNRHGPKHPPKPTLGLPTPFIAQVCGPSNKTRRHPIHIQPNLFRAIEHVDSGSPGSTWRPFSGVADEIPNAWFHRSGMSPQQQNPPPQLSCRIDPLQADQTSHMLSPADYAEARPSIWEPGPNVAGEASAVASSSQGWSSTAGEGASPEKVRRRRGRPRLYEDDGTEVPKRKPGRPLTYAPVTDSFGSRSSMTSSMSTTSPSSADGLTAPFWEGPSPGRSARPAKRNQPADEPTEQDPGEAAAALAVIRTRNKAAATRYRLKNQQTVDRMEAEEREASLRRLALLACADRLRGEVNSLKTEVMQHANCGCPHISGYIAAATQHTLAAMATSPASQDPFFPSASQQLPAAGVSSGPGGWQELAPTLSPPHLHLDTCPWQQGGFVMDNPVPGSYYAAAAPSAGTAGEVPGNADGYFQSPMSPSNADSG
jgi:hypothetical protein